MDGSFPNQASPIHADRFLRRQRPEGFVHISIPINEMLERLESRQAERVPTEQRPELVQG